MPRRFYIAVVQVILLFGLETWVVTLHIKRLWGGFHHRVARRISGNMPWWRTEGTWKYSPLVGAMRASGLKEIKIYISRQQNTVVQYIANRPNMDLYVDT